MKSRGMEYRVVSESVFGTFKCFDEDEAGARRFMYGKTLPDGRVIKPSTLMNDPNGKYRLERRPLGGSKDDWKTIV